MMKINTQQQRRHELISRLERAGFTYDEAQALRRIEMTLQRWGEQECGDSNDYASTAIERDEETGKPFRVIMPHNLPPSQARRYAIADREAGALKRLAKIMAAHSDFVSYHQGDCRGCNLYIVLKSDLNGSDIDANYTRGIAICD
jgi:hypothetical protein